MFKFKKSENYHNAYEAIRETKYSNHFIKVYIMKSGINKSWKCKAELWINIFEKELVKETEWIEFRTKKSSVNHCNEFFWNYGYK